MTKYVELNAVLDAIGNQQDGTGMTFEALSHAMRDVMSLPQVDAVPVVRCKDCKYYVIHTLFGRSQGWCERLCDEFDRSLARGTEPDDYCSRAERKEK